MISSCVFFKFNTDSLDSYFIGFSKVLRDNNIAFDLSSVSLYSFSGIESITIPAPD
jgi:hypothetical protein